MLWIISRKECWSWKDHFMKEMLTSPILWLRDTGILDKMKNDVINPPIPDPDPTFRHNQPLIIQQLGIIMIILVVGLFIGIIVFLTELLQLKWKTRFFLLSGLRWIDNKNLTGKYTIASIYTRTFIQSFAGFCYTVQDEIRRAVKYAAWRISPRTV